MNNIQNNNYICRICHKEYSKLGHLSTHVHQRHNIFYKDYYDKFVKSASEGLCKICQAPTIFYKGKYSQYCSRTCQNNDPTTKLKNSQAVKAAKQLFTSDQIKESNLKREQTCFNLYGTNNISQLCATKDKVENTFKEHYGDWYLNTPECKQAFSDKYGVDNPLRSSEILQRVQDTNMQRYGAITPAKNEDVKKQISLTKVHTMYDKLLQLSDVVPLFTREEYTGQYKIYHWKCVHCSTVFTSRYTVNVHESCPKCYPITITDEINIKNVLAAYNIPILVNKRLIIDPFELDYYIPDLNLAIEYNGLYWHSEISGKKEQNYHLQKTQRCEEKQIKLIQIFEDEWNEKRTIVLSKIKYLFQKIKYRIFARKCIVQEIDYSLKNKFLNKYHLQGEDKSAINLGLFYKKHLVAVMTFSKLRKALGQTPKENTWELSRYAGLTNFNIIGGASKLFTYFEKTYNPIKIITYADRRWSQGNLYLQLGFKLDHISRPNYWYIPYGGKKRYHRFNFRKNVLKDKLEFFDPNISEWENMKKNGYDRIWDCGNLVFIKNYPIKNLTGVTSLNPVPVINCLSNSSFSLSP
jgi:hypothetical protein